eukprot:1825182-Prorocentrum_lima.AAC.1
MVRFSFLPVSRTWAPECAPSCSFTSSQSSLELLACVRQASLLACCGLHDGTWLHACVKSPQKK